MVRAFKPYALTAQTVIWYASDFYVYLVIDLYQFDYPMFISQARSKQGPNPHFLLKKATKLKFLARQRRCGSFL